MSSHRANWWPSKMRLRHLTFGLACFVLGAGPSFGADDARQILSAGELGLTQDLRWGMSAAEAGRALQYQSLTLAPDPGPFGPRVAPVGTSTIFFPGCALVFRLSFFEDKLDHVRITAEDGTDCHERIERTLTARYDDPNLPASCPNIISRRWAAPGMTASYDYNCAPSRSGMF